MTPISIALDIEVYGVPAPKGSPRVVTRGRGKGGVVVQLARPRVLDDTPKTRTWARAVEQVARASYADKGNEPLDCPVWVEIVFWMARPASAPKRVVVPATKPDIDKITRTTLDALEAAGVLKNDSRVWKLTVVKRFAAPTPPRTGASIIVYRGGY